MYQFMCVHAYKYATCAFGLGPAFAEYLLETVTHTCMLLFEYMITHMYMFNDVFVLVHLITHMCMFDDVVYIHACAYLIMYICASSCKYV